MRSSHERAHCRTGFANADDSMERGDSGRAEEARSNQSPHTRAARSEKRNPAKAGIKFVHFGGILQTAGDRGDRGAV